MAKYKTTEPHLDCPVCKTRFTLCEAILRRPADAEKPRALQHKFLFCPGCNARFYRLPSTDDEPLYEVTWSTTKPMGHSLERGRHPSVVALRT